MAPETASNFAETFYKRLWHRGLKGRLVVCVKFSKKEIR